MELTASSCASTSLNKKNTWYYGGKSTDQFFALKIVGGVLYAGGQSYTSTYGYDAWLVRAYNSGGQIASKTFRYSSKSGATPDTIMGLEAYSTGVMAVGYSYDATYKKTRDWRLRISSGMNVYSGSSKLYGSTGYYSYARDVTKTTGGWYGVTGYTTYSSEGYVSTMSASGATSCLIIILPPPIGTK